jgi:hypothetical protein
MVRGVFSPILRITIAFIKVYDEFSFLRLWNALYRPLGIPSMTKSPITSSLPICKFLALPDLAQLCSR